MLTHDNGNVVGIFPIRWLDVAGLSLAQIVELYQDHAQRASRA